MQQERPPPYWRGTEQTVVVVLGHARDKLLPAHKSGLGFPRLERPGEVFVDRPLIIRKLVHAAKAEGFWQEAPDIGVSGRPADTLDPRGPHPDVLALNTHHFDRDRKSTRLNSSH